ncbi:MAG: hypothetical protein RMK99_01390 [Anaerolineales bacterium]|nr:hypothetical protein [Anaerolineales bacterium]
MLKKKTPDKESGVRYADAAEALDVQVTHDPLEQRLLGGAPGIQVAEHLLQLIGREDVAHHVEDLVSAEFGADLPQSVEHLPLARVGGDEVEDQAVMLLPVVVDMAYALSPDIE